MGLSRQELIRIVLLYVVIGILTGVGILASIIIGRSYLLLAGLGIVAYVFGLRHGVDADHIAAIDNTTRKLMHDGERPLAVGTWFSLGHSTVVVALVVLLVFSTRTIVSVIPSLQSTGAILGTLISGAFLWVIGFINVIIVLEIYRAFRTVRAGKVSSLELDELLNKRGFMNRYFGHLLNVIKKPWQIYPVGVLFGLGFDTASEIALIAITVGVGVTSSVPLWMILVLPFMFTCGMVLVDTSDAIAMRLAYGWAFLKPIRKIYYNLTITVISVLVAFLIGSVELMQVLAQELKLTGGFWAWMASLDFETIGYAIVAIFVISWLASIAIYRYKNFENRIPTAVVDEK